MAVEYRTTIYCWILFVSFVVDLLESFPELVHHDVHMTLFEEKIWPQSQGRLTTNSNYGALLSHSLSGERIQFLKKHNFNKKNISALPAFDFHGLLGIIAVHGTECSSAPGCPDQARELLGKVLEARQHPLPHASRNQLQSLGLKNLGQLVRKTRAMSAQNLWLLLAGYKTEVFLIISIF